MTVNGADEKPVVVGRGRRAEILAWGEGRVLKLYEAGWPAEAVAGEARNSRRAYELGLPVPAFYGTLEVDGRHGLLFERIDGSPLLQVLLARPWRYASLARAMADAQVALHARAVPEASSYKEMLAWRIRSPRSPLPDDLKEAALALLARLPEGDALCHGDFHFLNVLVPSDPRRGPVVIDWDAPTRGNPLADLARTMLIIRAAPLHARQGLERRLWTMLSKAFGSVYLRHYLARSGRGGTTPRQRAALAAEFADWQTVNAAARLFEGISEEEAWLISLVRKGISG